MNCFNSAWHLRLKTKKNHAKELLKKSIAKGLRYLDLAQPIITFFSSIDFISFKNWYMGLRGKNLSYTFGNGTEQVYDNCYDILPLSGHYFSSLLFVISV